KWDAKHAHERGQDASAPEAFVLTAIERAWQASMAASPNRGLRALDFAAGTGRHSLALEHQGFEVEAWDVSAVGLELLAERARAAQLNIRTRTVDLLTATGFDELESEGHFDLVVVCNFLDRTLYPQLPRLLNKGGHLLVTTFTVERAGKRPPLEFCLQVGELERSFANYHTVMHEEKSGRAGILVRQP
ncbi:MAG: tellurite methyltransferase, partial [Planctomycetota bacterium]